MMSLRRLAGQVGRILEGNPFARRQESIVALAVGLPGWVAGWMPPGCQLLAADDPGRAWDLLRTHDVAVVLFDRDTPDSAWKDLLPRFAEAPSRPCVVLVSGSPTDQLWEHVTESGGYDVLPKPVNGEEFRRVLQAAVSHWRSRRQLREMRHLPNRP